MTSFTFATFNMGLGLKDMFQNSSQNLSQLTQPEVAAASEVNPSKRNEVEQALVNEIEEIWKKNAETTAALLAEHSDAIALQEVSSTGMTAENRPDIQMLKQKGFAIVFPDHLGTFDSAIAIKKEKFDDLAYRSFKVHTENPRGGQFERDFAAVVATEKASGKKIAFVSAHISGFDLDEKVPGTRATQAKKGDEEIEKIRDKLKTQFTDCDMVILGCDMNASPEIYPTRFEKLKEEGFQPHRTNQKTNVLRYNFWKKEPVNSDAVRELDYVFVKQPSQNPPQNPLTAFFKKLFCRETIHVAQLHADAQAKFPLNGETNSSDHIPVFVKVDCIVKESLFSNFLSSLSPANLYNRVKVWLSPIIGAAST